MRKFFLFACAFVFLLRPAFAADIALPSCEAVDVQAAFNKVQAGDRIVGPVLGAAKWTVQVTLNAPPNLTVQAGCAITDNYKPSADKFHTAGPLLAVNVPEAGTFFWQRGFQVKADAANSNYKSSLIAVYGRNKQFRWEGIRCDTTQGAYPDFNYGVVTCFDFWGQVHGVLHNSEFNFADRGGAFVIHGDGEGDDAWAKDAGFGTDAFLFFETNKITNLGSGGTVNDCYHGGKAVIRYNDIQGASLAQTHPTGGSGRARGCRALDVYKNNSRLGLDGKTNFNAGFISGGELLFWGNVMPLTHSNMLTWHSMRVPGGSNYGQVDPPSGWGYFRSLYDLVDSAFDQPGRGKSDRLSGTFPSVRNDTKSCLISPTCTPDQATAGSYVWDNQWTNPGMGGSENAIYEEIVRLGRDVFTTPKPGYTPYVYPHPLAADTTPVPPIPPIPPDPQPVPNKPPTVTIVSPATTVITSKTITLEATATDDVGVIWMELWLGTKMVASGPNSGSIKKSGIQTAPYKGKTVVARAVAEDADGAKTEIKKALTVPK